LEVYSPDSLAAGALSASISSTGVHPADSSVANGRAATTSLGDHPRDTKQ
jgi:hypothetical protein